MGRLDLLPLHRNCVRVFSLTSVPVVGWNGDIRFPHSAQSGGHLPGHAHRHVHAALNAQVHLRAVADAHHNVQLLLHHRLGGIGWHIVRRGPRVSIGIQHLVHGLLHAAVLIAVFRPGVQGQLPEVKGLRHIPVVIYPAEHDLAVRRFFFFVDLQVLHRGHNSRHSRRFLPRWNAPAAQHDAGWDHDRPGLHLRQQKPSGFGNRVILKVRQYVPPCPTKRR